MNCVLPRRGSVVMDCMPDVPSKGTMYSTDMWNLSCYSEAGHTNIAMIVYCFSMSGNNAALSEHVQDIQEMKTLLKLKLGKILNLLGGATM